MMPANQRRPWRPHVRSGGRQFREFAVQRLSQDLVALGTPGARGWRQAEPRTHGPCRGTWGPRPSCFVGRFARGRWDFPSPAARRWVKPGAWGQGHTRLRGEALATP